jgi:aromatic ring-cleaving dioxygenase
VYNIFDSGEIKRALALRDVVKAHFAPYLGADCDDRYDFNRLCMIVDHDWNTTLLGGPFPSGEWSIFVPVGYFNLLVPWMMQHHGEFSMIVHPNTGFEYEDHSDYCLWAGEPWPLNMGIFEKGTQTNEFGHHRGDSDNPVCLPLGAQCGTSNDAPLALCCFGSPCKCAANNSCVCS